MSERRERFSIGQLVQTLDGRTGIVTGHTAHNWAQLEVKFDDSDHETVLADSIPLLKRTGKPIKPFKPETGTPLA